MKIKKIHSPEINFVKLFNGNLVYFDSAVRLIIKYANQNKTSDVIWAAEGLKKRIRRLQELK